MMRARKPRKTGRKPRTNAPTSMVGIRMNADERARYACQAKRANLSFSEWIRTAAEIFAEMSEKAP